MNDRGLVSEVNFDISSLDRIVLVLFEKASYLYSVLCHKHREGEKSKEKWIEIWLKPVIESLDTSNPLHRSLLTEVIY